MYICILLLMLKFIYLCLNNILKKYIVYERKSFQEKLSLKVIHIYMLSSLFIMIYSFIHISDFLSILFYNITIFTGVKIDNLCLKLECPILDFISDLMKCNFIYQITFFAKG
jgi:hypothetical protein